MRSIIPDIFKKIDKLTTLEKAASLDFEVKIATICGATIPLVQRKSFRGVHRSSMIKKIG